LKGVTSQPTDHEERHVVGERVRGGRVEFNGAVRIESRPERLSDNAGSLLLREYGEKTGILGWLSENIKDPRNPNLIIHPLAELLRTILFLHAQGWEDQDDADRLRDDPALRLSVSDRKGSSSLLPAERSPEGEPLEPEGLPSQPTLSRLVRSLSTESNRAALRMALVEAATRRFLALGQEMPEHLTIDLDLLPIEAHGSQKGARYHPYYRKKVYLPLIATIAETGDIVDAYLKVGTSHAKEGFSDQVPALLDRIEGRLCKTASVRMDAGFPCDETLTTMEERGTRYVARIRNNPTLNKMAAPFLPDFRDEPAPVDEEPQVWTYEMGYQATKWTRFRRVVLVVLEKPGELFCESFWLVTNWPDGEMPGMELLELYRRRGKAEAHMGEWMSTLNPRLSSTFRFKDHYQGENITKKHKPGDPFAQNEVILLLSALGYSLMHGLRSLMNLKSDKNWSIRKLRERVLRVASRFLLHARQVTLVVTTAAAEYWEVLLEHLGRIPALV